MSDELLNKDELVKSLRDLEFSEEEINSIVEKGEKEGKFLQGDDKKNDDDDAKTVDQLDQEEMKKAYDAVMAAKTQVEKAMEDFLNRFGNVPGFTAPADFVKKGEEDELNKSEVIDIEKAFGDRFDSIMKGFETQNELNSNILKSISEIKESVEAIAQTPNPLKGLFGNYNFIEKGEKFNDDGVQVVNLRNKDAAIDKFEKAIDKVENENDKQVIRDLISDFTISGVTNQKGLNIVKKALNIDFEK